MDKDPQKISLFFEKFKNLVPREVFVKESIISEIKNELGIDIGKEQIQVTKNKVFLSVHPAIKSELILQKDKLQERVSKLL